ncbi:hypothetical protein GCM10011515_00110 [Tsuneonella deserti]|uniref:Uncharacterized protein n=1 Tax=Tsuneonella deserti TaxID=2035528 RepID=A0ABQ1RVP7_9SPHN|nr:hypothetical protein [Tsuneonella deserti]GGD84341.1 hypothetical protein GCM10011515_00110 [Tsuneonella deserti]
MGKRNLAIVGTHEDFFADILDERTGIDPSLVSRCASAEDAATTYFDSMFRNSDGLVRSAVVAVWPVAGGREAQTVFDARAIVTPCTEADAEPGEVEVFLDVRART